MRKKSNPKEKNLEILPEYDFQSGVRGKYTKKYSKGVNIIVLDPDVAKVFPDQASVNDALGALAAVIHQHERSHH